MKTPLNGGLGEACTKDGQKGIYNAKYIQTIKQNKRVTYSAVEKLFRLVFLQLVINFVERKLKHSYVRGKWFWLCSLNLKVEEKRDGKGMTPFFCNR